MSREIKFRFWHGDKLVNPKDLAIIDGKIYLVNEAEKDEYPTINTEADMSHIIAEKFTGFTDIDGNPVYQGDVVVDGYEREMVVVFREHKQTLEFKALTKTNFKYALIQGWVNNQDGSAGDMKARVKIIGNIHKNKHLLED